MSESENVKRTLNQAAEIAKDQIVMLENDNRQLRDKLKQKEAGTKAVKEAALQAIIEKHSQQKKAETSLLFMFLFGCLTAVAIGYTILNCH